MNTDFQCTLRWVIGDVPHQIWESQTADGSANTLVTRFLHNKALFYSNNLIRCYTSYLSPDFVASAFSFIGLAFFLIGVFCSINKRNVPLLILIIMAPFPPLFSFLNNGTYQGYLVYGIEILVILFGILNTFLWLLKLLRHEYGS